MMEANDANRAPISRTHAEAKHRRSLCQQNVTEAGVSSVEW